MAGVEPILGSAWIDDFAFYKVEWAAATAPDTWSAVSTTKHQPVTHGLLDEWDTTRVPDGVYRLRLVAVNGAAQEVCIAVVEELHVSNLPTATPTPTQRAEGAVPTPGREMVAAGAAEGESAKTESEPTATLAPILPRPGGTTSGTLSWQAWWHSGPLRTMATSFANGLLAAIVIMALAWLVGQRRRGS